MMSECVPIIVGNVVETELQSSGIDMFGRGRYGGSFPDLLFLEGA